MCSSVHARGFQAFQRSETSSANVSHSTVLVQGRRRARRVGRLAFTRMAEVFTLREHSLTLFFQMIETCSTSSYFWTKSSMDFFTAVFLSPPAATWSRLRNSQVPGQVPLRSRQCPLGMMSLSPESQSKVRASNFSLEVASWFAEQILRSPQLQTFFLMVFPEDFGGDSSTGPASPWSAREFTDLSDAVEA